MDLQDFDYHLPPELIAQSGAEPRDASRLMVVRRTSGEIEHRIFRDLPQYLRKGDVLVLNQSKVIPARLFARKPTGAKIEVLLVREITSPAFGSPLYKAGGAKGVLWEALLRHAHKVPVGGKLMFEDGLEAVVLSIEADGTRILRFSDSVWPHLDKIGHTPLPPYIELEVEARRYQTTFARDPGSVAAPTAGLHFTPELLARLREMGVETAYLTLHVGPGTFKPVKANIEDHQMHTESYQIPAETAEAISRAKSEGRRVIAVGTTTVRALESAWQEADSGQVGQGAGETQIFIHPPYEFKVPDALITNFHLPKSTLLMLVAAFGGHDLITHAYREAIEKRYRFYSLGDAMLIF